MSASRRTARRAGPTAASAPATIVSGRPTASSRTGSPDRGAACGGRSRAASEKRTSARVASASVRTVEPSAERSTSSTTSGPASTPAAVSAIAAVTGVPVSSREPAATASSGPRRSGEPIPRDALPGPDGLSPDAPPRCGPAGRRGDRGVGQVRRRRGARVRRGDPDAQDARAAREAQGRVEHDGLAVDAAAVTGSAGGHLEVGAAHGAPARGRRRALRRAAGRPRRPRCRARRRRAAGACPTPTAAPSR